MSDATFTPNPVNPRVSVVIPTLNEARNLPYVFTGLPVGLHEVIVVDGHSKDDTLAVARSLRPDVRIVMQTRKGKGNALACGFAAATGDIIAMIDADGSTDPKEIPAFVRALLDGADFAKGSRFIPGDSGAGSSDITRLRRLGNRALSSFVNVAYGTRYSDLCYGFNVFWRRHLPVFGLLAEAPTGEQPVWGDGFEIETLLSIRVAVAGLRITEVPSYEHPRIHGSSNLRTFSDGRRVLRTIMAERRRARQLGGAEAPVLALSAGMTVTATSAGVPRLALAPVEPPVQVPVQVPVEPPVQVPVEVPVEAPARALVQAPVPVSRMWIRRRLASEVIE
ncbi:MAG TPA: glycosyltransferase family 2 protein [Streptosporangiaceae bacterium]